MKDNLKVIIFALVLATSCSLLLVAASQFTAPRRAANEEAEKVRNFLSALEIPMPENIDSKQLLEIYEANVKITDLGEMKAYQYIPAGSGSDTPVSIAVAFEGSGVWGPIKGVIATAPDMQALADASRLREKQLISSLCEIHQRLFRFILAIAAVNWSSQSTS